MTETLSGILAILFLLGGGFVTLAAAIGVARFPDPFMRMHASTKAGVVGAGLILVGLGFAFGDEATWWRVAVIVLFLLFTTPVSAHGLGLGAYLGGAPLWGGTAADQLAGVLKRHAFDDVAAGQVSQQRRGQPVGDGPPRRVLVALAGGTAAAASIEAGLMRLPPGPAQLTFLRIIDLSALGGEDPARLNEAREEAGRLSDEVGRIANGLGLSWTLRSAEGDATRLWREAVASERPDVIIAPISGWFGQGLGQDEGRALARFAVPAALPMLMPAPGAQAPRRLLVLAEAPGEAAALLGRFLASGLDRGADLLLAATDRAGGPAALAEAQALAVAAGRVAEVHPDALAEGVAPDAAALGVEGVVLDGLHDACRDPAAETACRKALRDAAPSLLLV
jgi:monovalent cation/proton antiporter MnhG/PhaG subunit